jgi:nuclear pore complex protein Nup133
VAVFAQPRGIFGRFFGAAANITIGAQGLAALVSNKQPGSIDLGSDLYAVSQQAIQKWNVSEGRAERIVYETEIAQLIRLRDDRISEGSHASESLKILDCSLTASGPLILLYGFAYAQGGAQHYGLASLEEDASGSSAKLTTISHLAYSCASDSRPYSQPRLSVPHGGSVLFIVYPEAVVFRLVDGDGGLEESVELRDVASNRFIGHGFTSTSSKPAASEIAHMPLVTRRSGLLVVEVDVDAASQISRLIASGEDRAVVDTHRLKSKLERGVFHADNLLNPISFDLPLEIRGDLMAAAEQLSDDILNSESPSLIDTLDTRLQLSNRLERLRALASYLSLNGMLSTMTQNSLRRLCADAQLLAAGCELWDYINELLGDSPRLEQAGNILEEVVDRVMEHEAVQSEDVLRDFFRDYLKHLNQVLERVQAIASASSSEGIAKHSAVVTETNRILLTVFQAAHRYRSESAELYQLDVDKIGYEAWTCTAGNVHSLQTATTLTSSLIRERTRHLGALIDKEPRGNADEGQDAKKEHERYTQLMLKGQLCELTGQLINIYEERLSYLSRAGAGNSALQREYVAICVKFAAERRAALLSLVHVGRTDRALYLAEQHRDFASLTELCSGPTSSAEQRPHRLRHYLNKYGEPFAVALYTFYVQTGQMHTLLTQDAAFYPLLQRFLDRDASLNRVAWLHDLAVGDERRAGSRLLSEADQERGSTGSKRLMLSLAKLCRVSQLDEIQIATQSEQGAIEAIDDQLDLINVHDRIINTLLTGRNDEDDETAMDDEEEEAGSEAGVLRAQQLVDSLSQNKPASASLFLVLAKQLLARRSLLSDDLIDLLTLHDASPTSQADFALSLEVFVRSRDMPAARAQYVLSSLWRRTLTFDDWNAITQTKGMSDEAINVRLRQTALYHLIASASGNESTSEAIRGVEEMLLPPSQDALEARLSIIRANVSDEQQLDEIPEAVDLQRESESEITSLQTLLREREMARWYTQVRRLVEEDLNGGQEEHTMDASREIELAGMQSIDEANSVEMV